MNDRELQNLVRMAAEIETLEREALVGPDLRRVAARAGDGPFPISRWLARAGLVAAAAGLSLGAFVALRGTPAPTAGPIARGPAPTSAGSFGVPLAAGNSPHGMTGFDRPLTAPASTGVESGKQKVVVFSLFKDSDGKCACYQWHETGERRLEDLGRGELMDIALQDPCTGEAQRVVVIAVGSKSFHGDLASMATQVAELPLHRDPAIAALAYPALFPNSTVITETVSMERVKLPSAADFRPQ